jgi:SNF2 family DNA or RNA helicase
MIEFKFYTEPFQHQIDVFEATKDLQQYAVFWEMGAGKSKYIIDLATWLFLNNKIDAVLIVAPNGVHANWDKPGEGVRRHMLPELLDIKYTYRHIWYSKRAKHKATAIAWAKLMAAQFAWLFTAVDALNTKEGRKKIEEFLKHRRVLFVIDESQRIKNGRAERTKVAKKLRNLTSWRRILTGTPMEQKPLDVYDQIDWLMPHYWGEQGFGSRIAFRYYFAEWRKIQTPQGREVEVQKKDKDGKHVYKNLDQLARILKPISSRVLKRDVLDLPPKLYESMYYDLSTEQRKLYDQMEKEYVAWTEDNSKLDEHGNPCLVASVADIAIVRQLRLHQLALGYFTAIDGKILSIADPNPALELLKEILEDLPHSAIIWCRFRKDVELIHKFLGNSSVTFHGGTPDHERVEITSAFQNGEFPHLIATNAMAEGWTLTRAQTCIYYSNDRKLGKRLQSEDRPHRPGQNYPVNYIDIIGENTISQDILDQLRHNEEVTAQGIGDRMIKRWK